MAVAETRGLVDAGASVSVRDGGDRFASVGPRAGVGTFIGAGVGVR